jgi:predicted aminopeptidase
MAEQKRAVFAALAAEYQDLKQSWGGFKGYDPWLANANNASLASISIYTRLVPAFQALLQRMDDDLPRFYAEVRRLADLPQSERHAVLQQLQPDRLAAEALAAE